MDWFEENGAQVKSTAERIVELVRERPQAFADSASATANQLVVPMLRALGWDCDDPERVQFRDAGSDGFGPVLRLIVPDRPGAIVLVSPLGGDVKDMSSALMLELVARMGVGVVAQTDGDSWRIYRRVTGWELELKRQSQESDHMRGYGLYLRLHESNIAPAASPPTPQPQPATAQESQPEEEPVLEPDPEPEPAPGTISHTAPAPAPLSPPRGIPVFVSDPDDSGPASGTTTRTTPVFVSATDAEPDDEPDDDDDIAVLEEVPAPASSPTPALASSTPGWYSLAQLDKIERSPTRIRFRDDRENGGIIKEEPARSVSGTYASIGAYLVETGRITTESLPIGITRTQNLTLNTVPEHPSGRRFVRPVQLSDGIWMETQVMAPYFAEYARRLFKAVDANPAVVEFNFDLPAKPKRARVEDGGWVSVAGLSNPAVVGRVPRGVETHKGKRTKVGKWHDAYRHVVQDLVDDGLITAAHLPIILPRARGKSVASTTPHHDNGIAFRLPFEVQEGMHFETAGTYVQIVRWMRHLLEIVGLPQESVKIQFATVMRAGPRSGRRRGRPPKSMIVDDSFLKGKHWRRLSNNLNVSRLPVQVRFGDDDRHVVSSWRHLYQTVANHLVQTTTLAQQPMPFSVTAGKRCAINTEPNHDNGARFGAPRELERGLWLEAGYPNKQVLRNMLHLLEKLDYPADNIRVRFA